MYPVLRVISLASYLCISLQGMILAVPFGFYLLFRLFVEGQPLSKILIAIADLALLNLFILTLIEKTNKTIVLEIVAYFLLLSPLVKVMTSVPIHLFNYSLFIIPTVSFVVLYPLSIILSYRQYKSQLNKHPII